MKFPLLSQCRPCPPQAHNSYSSLQYSFKGSLHTNYPESEHEPEVESLGNSQGRGGESSSETQASESLMLSLE